MPSPPPAEPQIVYQGGIGKGNALLLVGAGAGLAAGAALFFAAMSDDSDAEAAASYEDYDRISTRADRERIGAIVGAGLGVTFGVLAIYRIKSSREGTQVSLTPTKGGAAFTLERSW